MIRAVALWIAMSLLAPAAPSVGCVGRTLYIGTLDGAEGRVLVELYCLLIVERTGTTAYPVLFDSREALYRAAREGKVDILLENMEAALQMLTKEGMVVSTAPEDGAKRYRLLKSLYEQRLGLIWLGSGGQGMLPVIRKKTLQDFPALPRVLRKLSKVLDARVLKGLSERHKKGQRAERLAREFLRDRKLI